jgi:hypothetical protein
MLEKKCLGVRYNTDICGLEFESNSLEFAPTLPRAFVMEKFVSSIIAQAAAMGKVVSYTQ